MDSIESLGRKHWLDDWMEEFEVHDEKTVRRRLKSARARQALHERAMADLQEGRRKQMRNTAAMQGFESFEYVVDAPLVGTVSAGPGIEIESLGTCDHFKCRTENLNLNIGPLLQYYDNILVQGPSSRRYESIVEDLERSNRDGYKFMIVEDILTMEYLRKTHIADHLIYTHKPDGESCCDDHFRQYAANAGLSDLADGDILQDMAKELARSGGIEIEEGCKHQWYGRLRDPLFNGAMGLKYEVKPSRIEVAEDILRRDFTSLIFDSLTAKWNGVPLASLAAPEPKTDQNGRDLSVDSVATSLSLPILNKLTASQIVALRRSDPESFEIFRSALRTAIVDTIEEHPDAPRDAVEKLVWSEHMKPALARLEKSLKANSSATMVKTGGGLTLGVAATTIASIASTPWAAAILGTAAAATLPWTHIAEYIKDRKQAQMSDMFFLWKAQRKFSH
ncbi:hypothetical protein [Nocardia sp. XZ_19_369]|uniref:hypothetical protein n=1 Tax=Nocardia sp. XZ_19_369 TaxID=2769487 RepID=UPI00189079F6|nr:hypothetical protein [Nocardia sp. XZ_19_369]